MSNSDGGPLAYQASYPEPRSSPQTATPPSSTTDEKRVIVPAGEICSKSDQVFHCCLYRKVESGYIYFCINLTWKCIHKPFYFCNEIYATYAEKLLSLFSTGDSQIKSDSKDIYNITKGTQFKYYNFKLFSCFYSSKNPEKGVITFFIVLKK